MTSMCHSTHFIRNMKHPWEKMEIISLPFSPLCFLYSVFHIDGSLNLLLVQSSKTTAISKHPVFLALAALWFPHKAASQNRDKSRSLQSLPPIVGIFYLDLWDDLDSMLKSAWLKERQLYKVRYLNPEFQNLPEKFVQMLITNYLFFLYTPVCSPECSTYV